VGMLVTPPDVISQTILALPMYILFEAGIFFGRLIKKEDEETDSEETDSEEVSD
jgi:sec-independent protein translocase protein TatC